MDRVLGLRGLEQTLAQLGSKEQVLAIDLRGRDPDAAFSAVAREKGRLFFTYLDARFGREHFEEFLKAYFDHFAFQSISTEQFVAYLQTTLLERYPGIVSRDEVAAWVSGPGLPADALLPVAGEFAPVDAARSAWLAGALALKKLKADSGGWVTQQWQYFLDAMPAALTLAQMADLDRTFEFTKSANAEIAQSWLLLVIRHQYAGQRPARGLPQDRRPARTDCAAVRGIDEDTGRQRAGETRLRAGEPGLSSTDGGRHRCDRHAPSRGVR
jgi:hypothetical protein